MTDSDKIARLKKKILALLAKADSSTHEAERNSFAEKARELLDQHQMTEYDLRRADDMFGESVVFCPYDDRAYRYLAGMGARYLGCDCLSNSMFDPGRARIRQVVKFRGRESSRVTSEIMVQFWWRQCSIDARRWHREGRFRGLSVHRAVMDTMTALGVRLSELTPHPDLEDALALRPENVGKARKTRALRLTRDGIATAAAVPLAVPIGGRRE
jgi:hypothetical protein